MDSYAGQLTVLITFLLDVLHTLDHLTKAFQLINSLIVHCLEIVEAVRLDLENFKAEYTLHIGAYSFSARRWFDRACGVSAII